MTISSTYTVKYTLFTEGVTIEHKIICLIVFQTKGLNKGLNNVVKHSKPSTWRLLETTESDIDYKPN